MALAAALWLLYRMKVFGDALCGCWCGNFIKEAETKDLEKKKEEENLKKIKNWVEKKAQDQLNGMVEKVNRRGNDAGTSTRVTVS